MDLENDHVLGCGTPYRQRMLNLRAEIECLVQYGQMLAPCVEKAGITFRQFLLLRAMNYRGTKTVANLASIANVDQAAALDDRRALERGGFVTLEQPPTRYETPQAEKADRSDDVRRALAPVQYRLDGILIRLAPDPTHPWQGPSPRV